MGDAFKLSGDLGSAMNAYETAVEKDKNNIEAYMSMAKIWANSRQADLGVEKLESVIKLSPDYAPAYKMLYELYISLRKFDKVVPILDKYVSLSGNDIKAKGRLVKFLSFQAKDHERAIIEGEKLKKEFTPAAGNKEDEKFYTINRWMASSYLELEKYQESFDASKDLFDQIAQDTSRKSYESDYENMAKAALKLKKFDEASKLYEDVIKINSSKAEEIYGNFAKGYYDEKNYSKAIEFYLKKNGVKTLGVSDLFYLANCYYAQKDYVNSEKHYAKLIELSPSYVNAYYQRARSLENQDITEPKQYLASNAYSEVIRVASGEKEKNKRFLIDAYVYLAEKSVKDNDYQGAKSYYEMVLAIDPSNQTASQNISIINGGK
jgi:tetratricopeptide (TPR) repeat protein